MIEALYKRSLLSVSDAGPIESFVKRHGWRLGVGRFVAGEDLAAALAAIGDLERRGLSGILDLLGEFVATEAGAAAMTEEIIATLDALAARPIDKYMSVKPTQLGLGVAAGGEVVARENATRVAERAREVGARVCLDMENYAYLDKTLILYRMLLEAGHTHVSTVLQSYLKRSPDDLEALLGQGPKPTLRIVKGAYRERDTLVLPSKKAVDAQFREMVFVALEAGATVGVATHDEAIIAEVEAFIRGSGVGSERCEFQLLYGVKPALQARLLARGHRVRIYIPYGSDWYGYFSRRLAERPANLMFVVRGLFG